jgi:hypothetical protein
MDARNANSVKDRSRHKAPSPAPCSRIRPEPAIVCRRRLEVIYLALVPQNTLNPELHFEGQENRRAVQPLTARPKTPVGPVR